MRWIILSVLVAAGVGGCAVAVPMAPASEDQAGKQFATPPSGMAALYVFREGGFGAPYTLNITLGQRTIGALGADTWFLLTLPPGTHDLRCIAATNTASTMLTVSPGEARFFEAAMRIGPTCAMFEVASGVGRKAVLGGHRAAEVK